MSSFLPNIVVRQAIRDLKLKENIDEAALQEKIRAGLERLYAFQHEDGGWGWWETDEVAPLHDRLRRRRPRASQGRGHASQR